MGFFNLFGKRSKNNSLIKKEENIRAKLDRSPNYQMTSVVFRIIFLKTHFAEDAFKNNLEFARGLLLVSYGMCVKEGIKMPVRYKDLPITCISDGENIFGYVYSFNDAKYECECNYVAMMIVNGEKRYYTSEYYADSDEYGLCMRTENGLRVFGITWMSNGKDNMKNASLEDFKESVLAHINSKNELGKE